VASLFFRREKLVLARDVARMTREAIGAEHLSPDRPDELSISIIPETKETEKSVLRLFGRNYCCH